MELTRKQIADRMGISKNTLNHRLNRLQMYENLKPVNKIGSTFFYSEADALKIIGNEKDKTVHTHKRGPKSAVVPKEKRCFEYSGDSLCILNFLNQKSGEQHV